jgi:SAM-dependent methyltransferase
MTHFQASETAIKYLEFLSSKNGKIQQEVLLKAILLRLPKNPDITVLDAGCGPGWLAGELKKTFHNIQACDASEFFIQVAKAEQPNIDFKLASLDNPLPYPQESFDWAVMNMVGPDLNNLEAAFKNVTAVLKPGAKLLMTIPNPKYTYPAAEWKRDWYDVLLMRKPKLKIKMPPLPGSQIQREFGQGGLIKSYYYGLDNYLKAAAQAGLRPTDTVEIRSPEDSANFNLTYQLYRYPLLLLLEFQKS